MISISGRPSRWRFVLVAPFQVELTLSSAPPLPHLSHQTDPSLPSRAVFHPSIEHADLGEPTWQHVLGEAPQAGTRAPRAVRPHDQSSPPAFAFLHDRQGESLPPLETRADLGTVFPIRSYSKMESFIRSKYESKRWAMSGPRPDNPKDLEDGTADAQHNNVRR